jgi:hypothetical protein
MRNRTSGSDTAIGLEMSAQTKRISESIKHSILSLPILEEV